MLKKEQGQLYEEIYHLQNCELALGEYYQNLASFFEDQRWFWEEAVGDEVNHARQVGKLISIISSDPEKYALGRYRVPLLQTYLNGIYENIEHIKNKKLSPVEMLKFALDYENSMLETKPFDIVISNDPTYKAFRDSLASDLAAHAERIRVYAKQKISSLT